MIKAFIFDADGPLYQRGDASKEKKLRLLKAYGFMAKYENFDQAYNIEKLKAYVREESPAEMFANIFKATGIPLDKKKSEAFAEAFNEVQSHVDPSPDAEDILEWLHEKGYRVCVLTDSFFPASEKWPWFKRLGMDKYIDEIISSYDIRTLKDTTVAYQECLARLKVTTSEAVFVGHQQYELDGAKKAGVTSLCLEPIAIPSSAKGDYQIKSLKEIKLVVSVMS